MGLISKYEEQSIFDLLIVENGAISGLFDFLEVNNLSTLDIPAGDYIAAGVTNTDVSGYFALSKNPIPVSSGGISHGAPVSTCSGVGGVAGTGQDVSYEAGDDFNINNDFWKLPSSNHFGHKYRYCGITGGYTDGVDWFDVSGANTTKLLAFPDGFICDLKYVDCDGNFTMYQSEANATTNINWATAVSYCLSFSRGAFNSGWRLWTRTEANNQFYQPSSLVLQHKPWENTENALNIWTSTSTPSVGSRAQSYYVSGFQSILTTMRTSPSCRAFPVRTTNLSELP